MVPMAAEPRQRFAAWWHPRGAAWADEPLRGMSEHCRVADPSVHEVATVLTEEWDPLGVSETDEHPESEYLFEARTILAMLAGGATESELVDYMDAQGLGRVDDTRTRVAAARLVRLRSPGS
jgi:hypothetical protein